MVTRIHFTGLKILFKFKKKEENFNHFYRTTILLCDDVILRGYIYRSLDANMTSHQKGANCLAIPLIYFNLNFIGTTRITCAHVGITVGLHDR